MKLEPCTAIKDATNSTVTTIAANSVLQLYSNLPKNTMACLPWIAPVFFQPLFSILSSRLFDLQISFICKLRI